MVHKERMRKRNVSVIINSADVALKNVANWRKLFSTTPDQALHFYPSQISNGKNIVSHLNAIFECVDHWKNFVVA